MYISEIAKECSEPNPIISDKLHNRLDKLKDGEPEKNWWAKIAGISIKVAPLSKDMTEIFVRQNPEAEPFVYERLIQKFESHPLLFPGEINLTPHPGPHATREEWFEYYYQSKQKFKITHNDIAKELNISPGYCRQLYAIWKLQRE